MTDRSSPPPPSPRHLRRWLAPRLLAWYAQNRRDLPWRVNRDPYRIWVSEVMLQQTTVTAVTRYYNRFLSHFPTLVDLARADEQDVLRLWEGLGYYRRARDLRRSAQLIVEQHGPDFPSTPEALAGLPGLGLYTRNAVLSQAFELRLPILEANSQRVLSRLFAREDDPRAGPARRWLWQAAEELLPARQVGDFNQALMELGALVCTPSSPRCGECPLARRCAARLQGRQEEIPARAAPPAATVVSEAAVVVRRSGRVLLAQRPAGAARWANLWEFPHGERLDGETAEEAAVRLARDLAGVEVRLGPELVTIRHGVTRFAITMVCFEAEWVSGEPASGPYERAVWAAPAELAGYPVSSPQRRLARLVAAPGRQRRLF